MAMAKGDEAACLGSRGKATKKRHAQSAAMPMPSRHRGNAAVSKYFGLNTQQLSKRIEPISPEQPGHIHVQVKSTSMPQALRRVLSK
jgi:hypothetical protein